MNDMEYAPACGDEDAYDDATMADLANEQEKLERLVFEAKQAMNDLAKHDFDAAFNLMLEVIESAEELETVH